MGAYTATCFLTILLTTGHHHASSFSISKRSASSRSAGLSDALAILQRQRRQAGAGDPYDLVSERLLDSRPYLLDDISDWLALQQEPEDLDDGEYSSDWLSDKGNFKGFDDREPDRFLSYNLPLPKSSGSIGRMPIAEEASTRELDDIFSDDENDETGEMDDDEGLDSVPLKRSKEEMINVKGQRKTKKSIDSDEALSLNTLSKTEFKALMKAVEKLQRQAERLSESPSSSQDVIVEPVDVQETMVDDGFGDEMTAEPVSKEELESVFDDGDDEPIVEKTKIVDTPFPGPNGETLIDRHVETEKGTMDREREEALQAAIASEIEDEEEDVAQTIADELRAFDDEEDEEDEEDIDEKNSDIPIGAENIDSIKKYLLMNKYMGGAVPMKKRTTKRAVILPERLLNEASVAIDAARLGEERDPEELDEDEAIMALAEETPEDGNAASLSGMGRLPSVDMFMRKIIQLQDELDRLRMIARLEDLENDVLTDALNEATSGQKEGSVSDVEFNSLQEAIQIEEALQDLKSEESDDDVIDSDAPGADVIKRGEPWKRMLKPEVSDHSASGDYGFNVNALQHFSQDQQSRDEIASLFLKNAESCPAVREYSTNCELADLYSLPVDYEARALCNLHQMCYACGHSLQVEQEHCDYVYRESAKALCDNKDACVVESEIFLRTMKLKTRYVPHSQSRCRSSCTARFLGML